MMYINSEEDVKSENRWTFAEETKFSVFSPQIDTLQKFEALYESSFLVWPIFG